MKMVERGATQKETIMINLELLAKTIKNSGITIVALAEKMNISRETIYNRLKGKGEFTASEILSISEALHLDNETRDEIFFTK